AARPGARVHPRRRVRRGHSGERAAAEGRAVRSEAPDGDEPKSSRPRPRLVPLPPMGEHLTAAQRDQLQAELAELEGPRRKEIVDAIATARGYGDLSENFEYHAAKNEQGLLERKITMLRARLEDAEIVEDGGADVVG